MVYVYVLKDGNGKVIDVGESINPAKRLYQKTRCKGQIGQRTNFYGRTDITQEIVASFETKKEARAEEGRLKLFYGLEWTEQVRVNAIIECSISKRAFTMDQAKEIRELYKTTKTSQRKLANKYGVSQNNIRRILKNITYKEY